MENSEILDVQMSAAVGRPIGQVLCRFGGSDAGSKGDGVSLEGRQFTLSGPCALTSAGD